MTKKSFWKRCNRGFIVSMGLLAAVLIYILITQLMLITDRSEIRKLADDYRGYMQSTSLLTDEQIASLKNNQAMMDEENSLKNELSPFFVEDSSYLDAAVQNLTGNILYQIQGVERIKTLSDAKVTDSSCVIDQDVATYTATYSYTAGGDFMNYSTGSLEGKDNVQRNLQLSINCKKVNGVWKLYHVSQAEWQDSDQSASGGEK